MSIKSSKLVRFYGFIMRSSDRLRTSAKKPTNIEQLREAGETSRGLNSVIKLRKLHMTDSYSQYTITLDDDPQVSKLIARITGMSSLPFTSPEKLVTRAATYTPTAVFVDINLGIDISGLDYLSSMRQIWPFIPILVVTSDPNPGLIGKALASGANDFIRKPIFPDELQARLQSRLTEMREKRGSEELRLDDLTFNRRLETISKGDCIIHLAPLESKLLYLLANNLGLVITKEAIRQNLWGNTKICGNALDKKISNLRKAIKECGSSVQILSSYGGKISLKISSDKARPKVVA